MPSNFAKTPWITIALSAALGLGITPSLAAEWELRPPTAGAPPCRAVTRGETINTHILRNREGHLVVLIGHNDWNHDGAPIELTVSIDGGPPVPLKGYPLRVVVAMSVPDQGVEEKFKAAHTLDWNLPWGHFKSDVDGLGKAFAALTICPE